MIVETAERGQSNQSETHFFILDSKIGERLQNVSKVSDTNLSTIMSFCAKLFLIKTNLGDAELIFFFRQIIP